MEAGKALLRDMTKQDGQKKGNSKDYLAMGVFTVVLLLLVASVVYLTLTTNKGAFDDPLQTVYKRISDYWHEGNRLIEGKRSTWSSSKREKEIRKHLITGHNLYRKKIYRKSLHEFDKAIELDPNNYRAYFWRGRVYIKVNRQKYAR